VSAATKRALEEAIAAHVADEMPGSLSGAWLAAVQLVDTADASDPGNGFFFESAGSVITQVGLAATFMMKLQGDMR
jgi:hypothetical protein